ncbi:MAG: hypothetical protein FWB91_00490 [Defluviitaleaceae bacterium]|nr:hypothetical protein [Defluviitaleaceae bacterium]
MKCPYYNELGHECKLYNTKQDDYRRQNNCESSSNWQKCPNYEEAKKSNSPRL